MIGEYARQVAEERLNANITYLGSLPTLPLNVHRAEFLFHYGDGGMVHFNVTPQDLAAMAPAKPPSPFESLRQYAGLSKATEPEPSGMAGGSAEDYRWAMKVEGDTQWSVNHRVFPTSCAAIIAAKDLHAVMDQSATVHFEIRDGLGAPVFNWTERPVALE